MGVTISAYMFWTHDRLGAERQPDDNPRNLAQRNESGDVQSCAVQRTRNLLLLKGVIYLRRAWHGAHSATARSAHFTHNGSEGLVGRLARRYDCRYAGKHQLEDRGQLQRAATPSTWPITSPCTTPFRNPAPIRIGAPAVRRCCLICRIVRVIPGI